jgi:hypothetical protein
MLRTSSFGAANWSRALGNSKKANLRDFNLLKSWKSRINQLISDLTVPSSEESGYWITS